MSKNWAWIVALIAVLVIGCGGGGGGGGGTGTTSTTSTTSGSFTNYQVGAMALGNFVDPANIMVGETLQFSVFARNESGALVEVSSSNWTTTAPANIAGVSSGGLVTGVSPSGTASYTLSAIANGQTHVATFAVKAAGARVTGRVRNASGAGLRFARILFYNSSNGLVGSATTGVDGTFRAVVPTTAVRYTLNIDETDPTNLYYRQFGVGDSDYLMGEASCFAPLPTLSTGTQAALGQIFLTLKSSGPPPPPSGCLD